MSLGTLVITESYRSHERLHFINRRLCFYQCCLCDPFRRQSASARLRGGRPSSSPAADARLRRICRAESVRSEGVTRPRSELLGTSKHRSVLPSNPRKNQTFTQHPSIAKKTKKPSR